MIRSHEDLLALITRYGLAVMAEKNQVPELLAAIDQTLFDLYDTLERTKIVAAIGAIEGCRFCDEGLAIIQGELSPKEPP